MTKELERIWIDSTGKYPYFYTIKPSDSAFATTEYVRVDKLKENALRNALEQIEQQLDYGQINMNMAFRIAREALRD